jgi:eukaryotic-like serine/threonine-protein kinase
MSSVAPGEIFLGKYRIEEVLGQGGMGVVVSARHLELDELVAIKFLHPMFAVQHDQVERFLREGRAAAKIKSEHVARVRDVGKTENGAPYMILEHLKGLDLGQLIKKEGRVEIPDAVEYVLQACEALAEAHTSGIVHRDLKPANLFLTERADGSPCVKLLDFGISKLLDSTDAALTATNGMMGSPLYMAPEQLAAAKNVDKRVDLWALGIILFELLTAERPFQADTLPQLVLRVATDKPTPLRTFLPDAPEELEKVIDKCLTKPVDERFDNVGALAKALEPFAPPEALPSIERIARVLAAATTGGQKRTRTVRTSPQPESSASVAPLSQVESAATIATANAVAAPMVNTNMGSVQTAPPDPPPRRRAGLWLGALGLAAVAIALAIFFGRKPEALPAAAAPVVTPPPASETATATAAPPPVVSITAAPTPTPSVEPPASTNKPSVVVKAPVASAKPSVSAAKPHNCDPPYVIDSDGNKKYKMECL